MEQFSTAGSYCWRKYNVWHIKNEIFVQLRRQSKDKLMLVSLIGAGTGINVATLLLYKMFY
jgi:glucokinase